MGDGLKQARAATRTPWSERGPVVVGDRMRRDTGKDTGLIYTVVELLPNGVRAEAGYSNGAEWYEFIRADRIHPAGTVRRSGFTLLPKEQS